MVTQANMYIDIIQYHYLCHSGAKSKCYTHVHMAKMLSLLVVSIKTYITESPTV